MKKSKKITAWVLVLAFWFFPVSLGASQKNLQNRIKFLDNIENVEWYRVEGQNVIIGWKGVPENFYSWNHKTAVKASKASLYEVYVWSVRYTQKDWSPGKGGQLCITTAQMSRFGKSSCKK
ncbi:MAG: hypothetical protein H8E42_06040 [Nitrospinae bacterium]|nr:hypothetical protein [Nitrospinota bacterium]MBL7021536.1 hypothetical protein [Nitrospinaceae bacterium]